MSVYVVINKVHLSDQKLQGIVSPQHADLGAKREGDFKKKKIKERVKEKDKDGRGVKCGAPLLPQTHKKSTCRTNGTGHLLNPGRRH